jgi:hypothetical protein
MKVYDKFSAADSARLETIRRNANYIKSKENISIQEATKKATLEALNRGKKRRGSKVGGKRKSASRSRSRSSKGSMFDFLLGSRK